MCSWIQFGIICDPADGGKNAHVQKSLILNERGVDLPRTPAGVTAGTDRLHRYLCGYPPIPWTFCGVPFVAPGTGTGTRPTGGPVTMLPPTPPPTEPPTPGPPPAEAVTWTLKSGKILIMVCGASPMRSRVLVLPPPGRSLGALGRLLEFLQEKSECIFSSFVFFLLFCEQKSPSSAGSPITDQWMRGISESKLLLSYFLLFAALQPSDLITPSQTRIMVPGSPERRG